MLRRDVVKENGGHRAHAPAAVSSGDSQVVNARRSGIGDWYGDWALREKERLCKRLVLLQKILRLPVPPEASQCDENRINSFAGINDDRINQRSA
jgi:hypothetical protein